MLQFERESEKNIGRNSFIFHASNGQDRICCVIPCEYLADLPGDNAERAFQTNRSSIEAELRQQYNTVGVSANGELVWQRR